MATQLNKKVLTMDLKYLIISALISGMMYNDEMKDAKSDAWEEFLDKIRNDDDEMSLKESDEWEKIFDAYVDSKEVQDFVVQQYNQIRFIIEDVPWILAKK